jgi:hypothetical protein
MKSSEIIADLEYVHKALLKTVEGLSVREMTTLPVYDLWSVKDVLAHIIGWNQRVLKILPLILADRADEVVGVDVEIQNRQSVTAFVDVPPGAVLAALKATFQQIYDIITKIDPVEIDKRRDRHGRIITIRSYVIDIMVEHERKHALDLETWREALGQSLDPTAIKSQLTRSRENFMELIGRFSLEIVEQKNAVGDWSPSDIVGHVADWEQRILQAAICIYDPSRSVPAGLLTVAPDDVQNRRMVARRAEKGWQENMADLKNIQSEFDQMLEKFNLGDWLLRGSYPWPDDQGTIAELVSHAAEHYDVHLADLQKWVKTATAQPR